MLIVSYISTTRSFLLPIEQHFKIEQHIRIARNLIPQVLHFFKNLHNFTVDQFLYISELKDIIPKYST